MLEIKNISYKADNKKSIIKDVSFCVKNNEKLVITGPNGSGKSTLLKIIMGIIQPTAGNIIFNGKDITHTSITERANLGISFTFQTPITFKGITVKKILDIANHKNNSLCNACDYLSQVGLCAKEYLNRELDNKLSGGELKRIELATLLARNTEIMLFDEPEAGIDMWSFINLTNILKNTNSTQIIVSHQERIFDLADRVIILDKGTIKTEGKPENLKEYLVDNGLCNKIKRGDVNND